MIRVEIDELVLDGATRLDPETIRAATEAELVRRTAVRSQAAPPQLEGPRSVARELAAVIRGELGRTA